ncbi:MAG: malto-oligosyltrehalose synthase [Candidatus Competibacteraceae bacterium]|nr:malto-oligosyltrehalose synthase [Candidatus Competibacteraceae bacterium]MBK8896073.1 malto-oligosyltrehalose synthase [Candidatus Competibacteraceae bacterium]MBK9950405.1 malto-oligosyltrehalose synthase [Candidatus Competibacteraceae bacterium]
MRVPVATYRLQFTPDFGFDAATSIAPYLAELGISDIYASPILTPRRGSQHGYDVADPRAINPELGGAERFELLAQHLKQLGIGWVQDIVPNHMAFDSQNPMLVDVLENGPDSRYHEFFDIHWNHLYEGIKGRVLAPFLGKFYGDCLESGELQLRYNEAGLAVYYYEFRFPIRIESYYRVLTYDLGRLRAQLERTHPHFVKFLGVLYLLKYIPAGEEGRERYDQISFIKQMLWELWNGSSEVREFIEENIRIFNGEAGKPESFDLLESLLDEQFFRLSYWKVGNEELNYRRFFTINDLISLRIEDPRVFESTHELILKLVAEEKINGLRIDHIDGLYDPAEYLNRLREQAPYVYLVVEKILEHNEELPVSWPCQGTSGYDFLGISNGLFCDPAAEQDFTALYHAFTGDATACETLIERSKRMIVARHLAGDIDSLAHVLKRISERYRYASDFTLYGLKAALVEILVLFPVYRTYIDRTGASRADQDCMRRVIAQARLNLPNFRNELEFVERFLRLEFDENMAAEGKDQWLHFIMRLQQFTGPLMAKGVEDTVFYVYNRLLSLNEVGAGPLHFGIDLDEFHAFNQHRVACWPHAMNASATHDTKRGEDSRARLNVLSELPAEWEEHVRRWHEINLAHKVQIGERLAPANDDEYLFYQTLLGAYPFDLAEYPAFIERIKAYLIKAVREAKVHTHWLEPDNQYENALLAFAERVLEPGRDNPFLQAFLPFQRKIQHHGILNSLAQTLLKLTTPGLPDFYQGTELWDLSLVDPDNRRPVDFERRGALLKALQSHASENLAGLLKELVAAPEDGRIKLFLIYRALQARQAERELFQHGAYQKLTVIGSLKAHVVAFARELGERRALVVAPRFSTGLVKDGEWPLGEAVWHETRVLPPAGSRLRWRDALSGQLVQGEEALWLREALKHFPVALLFNEPGSGG